MQTLHAKTPKNKTEESRQRDPIDAKLHEQAQHFVGFANHLAGTKAYWLERAWPRDYRLRLRDPYEDRHDLVRLYEYTAGVYRVKFNPQMNYRFKVNVTLDELPAAVAWALNCYERELRGLTVHPSPPVVLELGDSWSPLGNNVWSAEAARIAAH